MALRRAILMKADPVVSLHAHRLFSGAHAHAEKTPVRNNYRQILTQQLQKCFSTMSFKTVFKTIVTFEEPKANKRFSK